MSTVDPALYRQLEALPEWMTGEILRGTIVSSPRPTPRHGRVIGRLQQKLLGPFEDGVDGPGGWWILPEPEVHLGNDVLVPDVAGWRRERLPIFPDVPAVSMTPDWVCEVLSPRGARRDQVIKRAIYGERQVPFLWFVDPLRRTLEVLTLTDAGWLIDAIFAEDDSARARPFEAIDLPLSDLWPD